MGVPCGDMKKGDPLGGAVDLIYDHSRRVRFAVIVPNFVVSTDVFGVDLVICKTRIG